MITTKKVNKRVIITSVTNDFIIKHYFKVWSTHIYHVATKHHNNYTKQKIINHVNRMYGKSTIYVLNELKSGNYVLTEVGIGEISINNLGAK